MSWLLNSSPYFLLFVSVQEKILIATWDDNNKELLAFQWCSSKLASSADSSSCYSWVHGFFSDFNCQRALMTVCEVPFLSSLFIFNCFFYPLRGTACRAKNERVPHRREENEIVIFNPWSNGAAALCNDGCWHFHRLALCASFASSGKRKENQETRWLWKALEKHRERRFN